MAITTSAKKAIRASARKRVFNMRRKNAIDDITKKIEKAVRAGKAKDAAMLVPQAYKAIDKAVKTNFLNKNTSIRMKSRLVKFIKRNTKK